ncbi:MAG: 3-dehydroquinate synthase [Deltaproteobacteria bacterium]|nr:3-dehydroquinate synthase [Deltaproteobacteria bacterium]
MEVQSLDQLEHDISMAKRNAGTPDGQEKQASWQSLLWYDFRHLPTGSEGPALLGRILTGPYTGAILPENCYQDHLANLPPRMTRVVHLESIKGLAALDTFVRNAGIPNGDVVVSSYDEAILDKAAAGGFPTCLRTHVNDEHALHRSIERGTLRDYLIICFRDPTNIPLELVIASLQASKTILIKEISSNDDVADAVVTLGVMEVGAEGILFSPNTHQKLDELFTRMSETAPRIELSVGTIKRAVPIGMGYRTCIDTTTLFTPTEGILIGSTSDGGILCCPEVFYLPYMELRPFRVNAGAVHSYVYNFEKTDYLSELKAGSGVMIVDKSGRSRRGSVGRTKTEMRPLRLIEAEFPNGSMVNIILQDDWHVRIFSHEGLPLNITELKPGDKILGCMAEPGRHVGIKVSEHIIER